MVKDVHCKEIAAIFNVDPSGSLTSYEVRNYINEYKRTHKCEKCGSAHDLTFHHVDPSKKYINVGDFAWKQRRTYIWSLKREMKKCELLCWKCHAAIHRINNKSQESQANA